MPLAVPTHLVDTMGSAAATGVEAAGHLLQEVGSAVSNAAAATSKRARVLSRHGRRSRTTGRNLVILGALAAVAALVVLGRRSKSRSNARPDNAVASDDSPRSSAKAAPSKDATNAAPAKAAVPEDVVATTTG